MSYWIAYQVNQQVSSVDIWIPVGISVMGVILSAGISTFIAGMRWGQVTSDIRSISDRLAKIEGMFTLQLRQDHSDGN